MLNLKHDIKINLKNEKEVFRLIRLLIFTFILSAALLGISDYIWNMTLYRISVWVVPWLVAIPAIINCVERKVNLKELLGNHILFQVLVGAAIGTAMAVIWDIVYLMIGGMQPLYYDFSIGINVQRLARYIFVTGITEELIYRIAIMEQLEKVFEKRKVFAPVTANLLFAFSHLFQHGWDNVILTLFVGGVFTLSAYKWKRCGFVMLAVMHGMFDFMTHFVTGLIVTFT